VDAIAALLGWEDNANGACAALFPGEQPARPAG